MELIKPLISDEFGQSFKVDESLSDNNDSRVRSFKRSYSSIEECIERIEMYITEHSAFTRTASQLGGDEAYLATARTQLQDLQQTLSEWQMSVGIASGDSWDRN